MSFQKFHNVLYSMEERREMLTAINDFLDESVVLPPGDWDSKNLLSMAEIMVSTPYSQRQTNPRKLILLFKKVIFQSHVTTLYFLL